MTQDFLSGFESDLESYDRIPMPMQVYEPIWDGDRVVDLICRWINAAAVERTQHMPMIGRSIEEIAPGMTNEIWFGELLAVKGVNRQLRQHTSHVEQADEGAGLFVGHVLWVGERVLLVAEELSAREVRTAFTVDAMQYMTRVMATAPIACSIFTINGWMRAASEEFLDRMQLTRNQFMEEGILNRIHPDDFDRLNEWRMGSGEAFRASITVRVLTPNGTVRWIECWRETPSSATEAQIAVYMDVDEPYRRAFQSEADRIEIAKNLESLQLAVNSSSDGYAIWRHTSGSLNDFQNWTLEFMNAAGAAPSGVTAEQLIGSKLTDLVDVADADRLLQLYQRALLTREDQIDLLEVEAEMGWVGTYENRVSAISDQQIVVRFRDVSEDRREMKRMQWLIEHDYLTGVANRKALEHELEHALASIRNGDAIGFAFLDIDDFKSINDEFGHEAGDSVLIEVAARLDAWAPEGARIARYSGDEFAVVLPGPLDRARADEIAKSITELWNTPVSTRAGEVPVTTSVGLVRVATPAASVLEVVRLADKAMYSVKHDGRNGWAVDDFARVAKPRTSRRLNEPKQFRADR